jgi:hypothetical protein
MTMVSPRYVNIVPDQVVVFAAPFHKCQSVNVYLMNFARCRVAFKLKTTSPTADAGLA